MHVISNTINVLTLVLGLIVSVAVVGVAVWLAWHYIKQSSFKAQGEILDRQEKSIEALRRQIRTLQSMARVQEGRISRTEIDSQRKDRLLYVARQEVEYFEDIVGILLPVLARIAPDDKKRADTVLKKLGEFRRKAGREQAEWEETKDALAIYLDAHPAQDEEEEPA